MLNSIIVKISQSVETNLIGDGDGDGDCERLKMIIIAIMGN